MEKSMDLDKIYLVGRIRSHRVDDDMHVFEIMVPKVNKRDELKLSEIGRSPVFIGIFCPK